MTQAVSPEFAARRDQIINKARACFDAGNAEAGMTLVRELVNMGTVNWGLLEQAWSAAELEEDSYYMQELLDRIEELEPGFRHPHLSLLYTRRACVDYQWQSVIEHIHEARRLGYEDLDNLHVLEAYALERLFRPEEALELLDRDFHRGEDRNSAAYERAVCLEQLGRVDEAREVLEQWLPHATPRDRLVANGHRELARILDRKGEYAGAWEEMNRGNQLAREVDKQLIHRNVLRWRTEAWRALYDKPAWVQKLKDKPVRYEGVTPVFLVGFPRSGTTLLEQVLDAHAGVQALEEKPMIYRALGNAATAMNARAQLKGKFGREMHRKAFLATAFGELPNLGEKELQSLRDVYFRVAGHYLKLDDSKVFLDKNPLSMVDMGFVLRLFPGARFIVALRHPADCVLSSLMQNFSNNDGMANFLDPEHAASLYKHVMSLLWQYERVLGISGQMHYIRYEDLVEDFESQVTGVLDFMGLEWDDAVTRYHEHAMQRGSLATPSYTGVTQKLYKGAMNRWHNYAEQMAPYLHHFRDAARRYDYSLELPEGIEPGAVDGEQ